MSNSPTPDLIKVSEIFLIPSTFLVATLGKPDTNFHRAAVSAVGLVVTIQWWIAAREDFAEVIPSSSDRKQPPRRIRVLCQLPIVFVVGWAVSLVAHLSLCNDSLGRLTQHEGSAPRLLLAETVQTIPQRERRNPSAQVGRLAY